MGGFRIIHRVGVGIGPKLAQIFTLLIVFVILPSPALQHLISIDIKEAFPLAILSVMMYLMFNNACLSQRIILLAMLLLIISAFASILSNSTSQLLMGLALFLMILISKMVETFLITSNSINIAYYFTVILLVGAWIGFFYALLGGAPLVCVDNPDGRQSCLFLATLSNSANIDFLRIIRPAGVFDEPGALSFFTILVVCLNELGGGGKKKSITLLLLGIITLSLTHIVCIITYCFIIFRKKTVYLVLVFGFLLGYAQIYSPDDSLLYSSFFSRFVITDEGLKGDNRSNQVKEFFSLIDSNTSRYGDNVLIKERGGVSQSEAQTANPFSIWFAYGFIMWIPYAITLLFLIVHFFNQIPSVKITSILLFFLLLQRPYIYSMYWGLAIWFVIASMIRKKYVGSPLKLNLLKRG